MKNVFKMTEKGEEKFLTTDVSAHVIELMLGSYVNVKNKTEIPFQRFLANNGISALYFQVDSFNVE